MVKYLERILLHIYCLPLWELALYGLIAGLVFSLLYRWAAAWRWLRPGLGAALICWAAAVLWTTAWSREGGSYSVEWVPLHTYWTVLGGGSRELLRSAFMNGALFYPAGVLLAGLTHHDHRAGISGLLLLVLFSLGIELCQYHFQLGTAEIDDVLHNTLGAGLGYAVFRLDNKGR